MCLGLMPFRAPHAALKHELANALYTMGPDLVVPIFET